MQDIERLLDGVKQMLNARANGRSTSAAVLRLTKQGSAATPDIPVQEAHILRCALRCFAEGGYVATSVRTIASAAGVTAPMINYYFGSKEELYRRISELVARALLEHLDAATSKGRDFWSRLMGLVTAAVDFAIGSPDAAAFLFDAMYGTSAGRPRIDVDTLERSVHGMLERLIASAVARRELRLRDGCHVKDVQRLCMMVLEHVIGRDFARSGQVDPTRRNEMVREGKALLTVIIEGAKHQPTRGERVMHRRRDRGTNGTA